MKATGPEEAQKSEIDVRTAKEVMGQQQNLYESRQALYKEGAISQKDVNDAQVAFAQARNQHEIAQKHLETVQSVSREQTLKGAAAQRDAAKARFENAEAQLSYSRITSPI
ncbi:MAG: efflux RND transporter periplasmic adaptor subunit, partial [Acidobacteria bacterium]